MDYQQRVSRDKPDSRQVRLHKGQSDVIRYLFPKENGQYVESVQQAVVVASRGFGKTYVASAAAAIAVDYLVKLPAWIPNKNVSIVCTTYEQTISLYWPLLAGTYGLERKALKSSKSEGVFYLPNNVCLKLWSYEAAERARGTGQFLVIADEATSWKTTASMSLKDSFESVLQPTQTTRWPGNFRTLIISTPKGYDYFYDLAQMETIDPSRWKTFHYTYRDSPYLSAEEIERIKGQIDPIKFAREYEASFKDSGNNVFYMFDRKKHVRSDLPYFAKRDIATGTPAEDVHISIDFNVGIMAATCWAIRGNQMHALKEFQGHPDTDALAARIKQEFGDHKIYAYPDPSGRARKTSAAIGSTDFTILESYGITCRARTAHPAIVDSVAAVNRKLMNANGVIDMYFSTEVPGTIKSMERTIWVENNPNTATIDKKEGVEHFSDGTRYITEMLYPIKSNHGGVKRGFSF